MRSLPELQVEVLLQELGIPFSTNVHSIIGRPDFFLAEKNIAIFVDGCFWHFHHGCTKGRLPTKRTAAWLAKLNAQKIRDREVAKSLNGMGVEVLRIWECQISDDVEVGKLLNAVRG